VSALILTYHSISDRPSEIAVSPDRFASQIDELVAAGYRFETVSSIIEPSRVRHRVAVCFDDGFQSVVSNALPVLERVGAVATVFPIVGGLGRRAVWSMHYQPLIDEPLLDMAALTHLTICGWEVGSHGLTHRCLLALGPAEATEELRRSRVTLEARLGLPVNGFAYPQGCWSADAVAAVRRSGYRWACSTLAASPFLHWTRWLLPRVTVGASTSALRFRAARVPPARALRVIIPGRDSVLRRGHRHGEGLDSTTFVDPL
jgi:peptidoglycan/xylan/chitin deacetylase (PgdA/CDA1 family)